MSDVMHGPTVLDAEDRRRHKTYLIALLDDATRMIPYAAFTRRETVTAFLPVFERAILRRGIPKRLYVDNDSAYRARHLALVCAKLDSLVKAIEPGGPLAGWIMSHGHVVLAHGAVPVGNIRATAPWPHLLLYAPSPSSAPSDWRDFDGPDGPYQLIGWAYTVRCQPGSRPPRLRCIADDEWYIHDAGWHLTNGKMLVTPDASAEPPRPKLDVGFVVWHPQYWDLHVWPEEGGVPTVTFANPRARPGGLSLPDEAFFRLVNGRRQSIARPK